MCWSSEPHFLLRVEPVHLLRKLQRQPQGQELFICHYVIHLILYPTLYIYFIVCYYNSI